jgi:hypothetical protein
MPPALPYPQQPKSEKPSRVAQRLNLDWGNRPPLPPGHPITWKLLTDGTLLEGSDYPFPVFFESPEMGKLSGTQRNFQYEVHSRCTAAINSSP